jgi:hypothetical protein
MEVATKQLVPTDRDLLRPDQIDEMEQEKAALIVKMHNPVIEKGPVRESLRRLERQLETQRPRSFEGKDLDRAVAREQELREKIREGMLSHEEMRKNPSGAVDRHRAWEREKMPLITEWQNIQRCLHADNDNREMASIESFRPTTSTMNMDSAQIPGKQFHLPPPGAAPVVTFNAEQLALLRTLSPQIAEQLGTLSNEQRREVKDALSEKPKRTMTPEHKAKMLAGAAAARAKKAKK